MAGHLSEAEARDLITGDLSAPRMKAAERHLDGCKTCLRFVAAIAENVDPRVLVHDGSGSTVPNAPQALRVSRQPGPDDSLPFRGTERFQVIRRLGEGGMGAVYEAYDRESDSLVALKTLHLMDAHNIYRFKNEFRELAEVKHPNLVSLGELHCVNDRWFFTMELVRGVSFLEYVRVPRPDQPNQRIVDEARLRDALGQLAQALYALHESGRIHRDIKPSNIVVTDEGRAVLLDFGLILRFETEQRAQITEDGMVGTPAYMAPEQATPGAIGPAADWYSVGILLHEALTGQVPFAGAGIHVMMAKQSSEPDRPGKLVAGVPADLDALTESLLRRQADERPGGAEILELLGVPATPIPRARSSQSVAAEPPALVDPTLGPPTTSVAAGFVGRQLELGALAAAFAASEAGTSAAVLVHGEPGIGKTAVVERFLEQLRADRRDVLILRGRCYEQENVPFNAFDGMIDALSHYLKQLDEVVAAAMLPPNIQLLASMFPVLRRVPVVKRMALGRRRIDNPEQLRRQGFAVLRQLFESLAVHAPVVIFADDLQWANHDSLALLEALLAPPDPPPLLLLATVRSTAGNGSAVLPLPESVRAHFTELPIGGLNREESRQLLLRLLENNPRIAEVLQRPGLVGEARGHPLFLQELVRHVSERHDADVHVRLEDMLLGRVTVLEEAPLRIMEILALAGVPLQIDVVSSTAEMPVPECISCLRTLRTVQLVRVEGVGAERTVQTFHDRVREAIVKWIHDGASTRFTSEQLQRIHLRIGRHLLEKSGAEGLDSAIFYIVHHLGEGQALIDDPAERLRLVELNLHAGRVAVHSTAYELALPYLRQARALLPLPGAWTSDYALCLALHREWMACEHLAGNFDAAQVVYRMLLEHAHAPIDQAEVHLLWVQLTTSVGRFHEAIAACRAGLRLHGVSLPAHAGTASILAEHYQLRWALHGRSPEQLHDLPECTDERLCAVHELLVSIAPAAFFADVPLLSVATMRLALLSLKHGVTSASSYGFATYGITLSGGFGKHEEAHAFGELALRLDRRFSDSRMAGKLYIITGCYLTPWLHPFAQAIAELDQSAAAAQRDGDFAYEGYAWGARAILCYCDAPDLDSLQSCAVTADRVAASRREDDMAAIGAVMARYCIALRSSCELVPDLSLPDSRDSEFRASLVDARFPAATLYYGLANAELCYLFGEPLRAWRFLRETSTRLDRAFSIPSMAEYLWLEAMVAAQLHASESWRQRRSLAHTVARNCKRLARWAETCPANYEAGYLLVRAESERIAGHAAQALASYEAAVASAREHHHPRREAIALELAARLSAPIDAHAARSYAEAAIAAYARWGAAAKAAQLSRAYDWTPAPVQPPAG